ncbi:MAG: class I SAM-dependent methyltransferase [Bacteroidota bacterium]
MTWEETILYLRTTAFYNQLIKESYLEEDLIANAERFEQSDEFKETLRELKDRIPEGNKLLDVGAGNGIATAAFSKLGYKVTALEPDPSITIGAGAIRKLTRDLDLNNVVVVEATAEKMPFPDESFDIVYVRQAMHHASDLPVFISECARVLKKGGILFTVRDHVIYGKKDKSRFLKAHPMHKFYWGENAFKDKEYRIAMRSSKLTILKVMRYFDSVINYFPLSDDEMRNLPTLLKHRLDLRLISKIGEIGKFGLFRYIYRKVVALRYGGPLDEKRIPGRMYSYIAQK